MFCDLTSPPSINNPASQSTRFDASSDSDLVHQRVFDHEGVTKALVYHYGDFGAETAQNVAAHFDSCASVNNPSGRTSTACLDCDTTVVCVSDKGEP